ncbi:MAG: hypothetical protein KC502_22960 [Myxococcales bacterium]|nr:hypothetical protein [Myxococcales bacterium]
MILRTHLGLIFLTATLVLTGCGADREADTTATDAVTGTDGTETGADGSGGSDAASGDAVASDAGTTADAAGACGAPTGERPARRSEQAGAWDSKGQRLVMFGGSFAVPKNCSFVAATSETETWIYDKACDSWKMSQSLGPMGRGRAGSVWKEGYGLIIFGGRSRVGTSGPYTMYNDTWAFNPDTDKWTLISAKGPIAKRFNVSMVIRDDTGDLLVFGGNTSGSALQYTPNNDVWSYNFKSGTWTEVKTAGTPPAKRFFSGGLWDSKRKRFVIYGGADASLFSQTAKFKDDLWGLDFSETPAKWTKLDTKSGGKPDGRYWSELVYYADADRYVMFGGHDDKQQGNRNDLWGFDATSGQWATMLLGDVYQKPAISFCNFPPDFTKVEEDVPERRNGGLVVGSKEGVWIAGGKTDCGVIDDLHFYSYKTGKWAEVTGATVGEACLRKGGVNCNDYCQ